MHKISATRRTLTEDEARALRGPIRRPDGSISAGVRDVDRHRAPPQPALGARAVWPACAGRNRFRLPRAEMAVQGLCEQEAAALRQGSPTCIGSAGSWCARGNSRSGRSVRGKCQEKEWTWPQARKYASEKLADTPWAGGRGRDEEELRPSFSATGVD